MEDYKIYDDPYETYRLCKCCNGTGIQKRKDGLNVKCPECNGTGRWDNPIFTRWDVFT